ncbi:MAG: hypothetical protein QXE70_04370 [Ignisphaera sp.]
MGTKCVSSNEYILEIREEEGKIIIVTWSWTIEIKVEKIKDMKVIGKVVVVRRSCLSPLLT